MASFLERVSSVNERIPGLFLEPIHTSIGHVMVVLPNKTFVLDEIPAAMFVDNGQMRA